MNKDRFKEIFVEIEKMSEICPDCYSVLKKTQYNTDFGIGTIASMVPMLYCEKCKIFYLYRGSIE